MLRFDRIEAFMKFYNLTQKELLQKAGQSPNNFARWKSGKSKPSYSSISALANVLGVDVGYIMGINDSPYGGELIERAIDRLENADAKVEIVDNDNGAGTQYIISYNQQSLTYNEVDFKQLCGRIVTAYNDASLFSTVNILTDIFHLEPVQLAEDSYAYNQFSKDELDLIKKYRNLDEEGKIIIKSALITESRRLKK